jgi:hypothetical protein
MEEYDDARRWFETALEQCLTNALGFLHEKILVFQRNECKLKYLLQKQLLSLKNMMADEEKKTLLCSRAFITQNVASCAPQLL